jgi:hypothetical protein
MPLDPITIRAASADVVCAFPAAHVLDARDAMQGALEALEDRERSLEVIDRTCSQTAGLAYVRAKIDRLRLSLSRFNERAAQIEMCATIPPRSE